jgi:methyltransferase
VALSANPLFLTLVALTAAQRVCELSRSRRNQGALDDSGFSRVDTRASYHMMVFVHSLWFLAMLAEHVMFPKQLPRSVVLLCLGGFISAQLLRIAVMRALGIQWNTQVMAPKDARRDLGIVTSGPYRFIRHPNYLAVIMEFAFLPLIGGAIFTALVFSAANALVLRSRIQAEERYLFSRVGYPEAFSRLPRLLPKLSL